MDGESRQAKSIWMAEMAERFAQEPPLYHMARPEDVVEVIAFLVSRQTRFITGETTTMR
jgi:NAD(P)-dependent dehydrogenase (short-subunit alcohol dehydrogenase family)